MKYSQTKQTAVGHTPQEETQQLLYSVLVFDDGEHSLDEIVEALQSVCGHSETSAYALAQQMHREGRAAVWCGPYEVAELKQQQLVAFQPRRPEFWSVSVPRHRLHARPPLTVTLRPIAAFGQSETYQERKMP